MPNNSPYRINIGCGMSPTANWLNFDNSLSLRLSKYPALISLLKSLKLLRQTQIDFIHFCQNSDIYWADVTKKIPLPDASVEIIYSSHMLEHLDKGEVDRFFVEVKRILIKGGILRLAIPDLEKLINSYVQNRDAEDFMDSLNICKPRPKSLQDKIRILAVGSRHHQWLYDANSLSKLLLENGFSQVKSLEIGMTLIPNPGDLNLYEDAGASMYIEAIF
jgi:predicted SAM-dependent methyltransferase